MASNWRMFAAVVGVGTLLAGSAACGSDGGGDSLTITANAINSAGGKNAAEAQWIEDWVIPKFVAQQQAKGVTVKVRFQATGVPDEDYKSRIAKDLKTGTGADVVSLDGIWVGEFAEGQQIKPLDDLVGADKVAAWDGWRQIPESVQRLTSYHGVQYGVPQETDGRVLFFNRKLFQQAGLPADWQPTSWDQVLEAGRKLKSVPGVIPVQLNAGTSFGEATTTQGVLPLLAGAGTTLYEGDKWVGNTAKLRSVLDLYRTVYDENLGDAQLQQDAKGREKSFEKFAKGQVGILLESDYLWRGVLNPKGGSFPMAERDTQVGWAKVPAATPGTGVNRQDFVSVSGGGGRVINPKSKHAELAWELLQFMNSPEAFEALLAGGGPRITARQDVNAQALGGDPMLTFVSQQILPITSLRPALPEYTKVSKALQQATLDVITGKSTADAAAAYAKAVADAVGKDKVAGD
ncbi:carbohydrate ABC transporter substrate-binding protein (CUT1 family) [Nocardia tenerifensis]|uniref:Carbohydrate ABC transporter substrate-binding protein (CUT1 family) n=1 Tax=Nocardia tenerifensis TaxID=228006 RepID=A0A318JVX9_9NOCA|nr:extracellular solute-binding protein [Nocardia tenerifensis]PXX57602.1 carbohydrate ABC transporter substrate-binding protein (CUT1 family) [Nocardia tenerifensis]